MAMTPDWFVSALSQLTDPSRRLIILSELKTAVSALSTTELKHVANMSRLELIFSCLEVSDRELIKLGCEVLSPLLSTLDSTLVLQQYNVTILQALGQAAPEVKELVLKELLRAAKNDMGVNQICENQRLLIAAVNCLGDAELSVAQLAISLLVNMAKTTRGLHTVFSNQVMEALRRQMEISDTVRFRVYEVVLTVATLSPQTFEVVKSTDFISSLMQELNGDDVLLHLNVLELLTKLALCEHGCQFLESDGTIAMFADRITSIEEDPLGSILLPGLIRFFGNVAHFWPKKIFSRYPKVVNTLFELLESKDLTLLGVAMETIGYVGMTVEGKLTLQVGDKMPHCMASLGSMMQNLPTEWRIRALNTVANLLKLEPTERENEVLTKHWFTQMSPDSMDLIMSIGRQPFPELRLATLQVMEVVAQQKWGQEEMNNCAGFIEFLLDRSIETNKLCKDAKYEVARTLVESPTASSVFNNVQFAKLQEFVSEGPFFVRTQAEVAVEGAS